MDKPTHDPKHLPRDMSDLIQRIGELIQDDFTFCDWKPGSSTLSIIQDGREYALTVRGLDE